MRKQNFIYGAVCVIAAAGTLCLAPGILNGMGKGEKQISSKTVQTADALTSETREQVETTMANTYESLGMKKVSDTVVVTADALRYRSAPDTSADNVKGTISGGTRLERIYEGNGWSVVKTGGGEYYVSSSYVKKADGSQNQADAQSQNASENKKESQAQTKESAGGPGGSAGSEGGETPAVQEIGLDGSLPYAGFSKINSGKAVLYKSTAQNRKNKTIAVNAGHDTSGGSSVKTQCHPDGSPKVTGGTTASGAVMAVAVSGGMTFADGTAEAKVTLQMAKILKDRLLAEGYDVLMLRDGDDVQLDNVARSVLANRYADCHISLHWDSTSNDKGCFYMSVPNNASYRAMEPVASHWQDHNRLGEALVGGLRDAGNKIFSGGSMEMDLTQTSYSTVPSVDIELGDKGSSHSDAVLNQLADGLVMGVNRFFGQ